MRVRFPITVTRIKWACPGLSLQFSMTIDPPVLRAARAAFRHADIHFDRSGQRATGAALTAAVTVGHPKDGRLSP